MKKHITILLLITFCFSYLHCIAREKEKNKEEVTTSVDKNRQKIDYLFQEAVRLKQMDRDDDAFEILRYCYQLDSLNAPIIYELSLFYYDLGQVELSKKMLQRVIDEDKNNKWYKWALAQICIEIGDTETTIPLLEEMNREMSDNWGILETLVELYTQTKQYDKSIEILNRMEKEIGINEMLSMNKFHLYLLAGDEPKGMAEIDRLIEQYPDEIHYWIVKGDLLFSLKHQDEALKMYQKAKAKEPNNSELAVSLVNYNVTNNLPVEVPLRTAIFSETLSFEVKLNLISNYSMLLDEKAKEKVPFADSLFQKMNEVYPFESGLKAVYSNYLIRQGRDKEAIVEVEAITNLDPSNEKAWEILTKFYLKEQNFDKLASSMEEAVKAIPDNSAFWLYLGLAYAQKEEYEKAMSAYRKGLLYAQNEEASALLFAEFYCQIGDLLQKRSNPDEVYEAYDTALKYDPQNTSVLNNYSYYLSLQEKDLDRAEQMSRRCIEMEPNNPTFLDTYAWICFVQQNYTLALFYIERTISKGINENDEVLEHYGDILYMNGEKEKALIQWKKAKILGGSSLLPEKIKTRTYVK